MILPDLSFNEYKDAAGWNATSIKLARSQSLAAAKALMDGGPGKESAALDRGRMVHTFLLEPERFETDYTVSDLHRSTKAFKELAAAKPDTTFIKTADILELKMVENAVLANSEAVRLLRHALFDRELSCFTTDPTTGLSVKARLDIAGDDGSLRYIADIKTTRATSLEDFGRSVETYGYDIQFAHYRDVYCRAQNNPMGLVPEFFCIAIFMTMRPIECVVFKTPVTVMTSGNHKRRQVLAKIRECTDTGHWPGLVDGGVAELPYPEWAIELPEVDWGGVDDEGAA